MNANDVTYSCMCNNEIKKETAFCYLEDLRNLFVENFRPEQIAKAGAFALNDPFKEKLKTKMVIND